MKNPKNKSCSALKMWCSENALPRKGKSPETRMVTDKGVPTKPEGFVGRGAAVRTTKPLFRMKMRRVTRTRRDDGGELGIRTLGSLREHSISSAAPSTTRTTLRVLLSLKFCEKPKGRTTGQNSKIFDF